ncbi:MAG: aldo/keto reductase [Butyricicoccaceae bacterium]
MQYRMLGNTGLRVSEIGLGCEGFVDRDETFSRELLGRAMAAGVNIIDIYTPNPAVRTNIGRAIAGRRQEILLQSHLCSVWKDGQYKATRQIDEVKAGFEEMLRLLDTDYIDIGMIHYIDSDKVWEEVSQGPVLDYARQLKAEGRIRHIGVSSHNPKVARKMVESGAVEVLMFSVNPCYDLQPGDEDIEKLWADESYAGHLVNMDPDRQALYELCESRGVGITVMKAFGGGDLLTDQSPAGRALTVNQCIHYALTRPAVASVMSGARSLEELEQSLGYVTASPEDRDYAAALAAFPRISWVGHCMYCGHCAPCPAGISVADVTKLLHLVRAKGGMPETEREHYAALDHHAGECLACGACESRCPFGVRVIENMQEAARVFGR